MCVSAYIGAKLEKDWRLEIRIRDFFLFRVFFVSESCGRGKKTKKELRQDRRSSQVIHFVLFSPSSLSPRCAL